MTILVVGNELNLQECQQKFGQDFEYLLASNYSQAKKLLSEEIIVFDFEIKSQSNAVDIYFAYPISVFLDSSKIVLSDLEIDQNTSPSFFGFCGLPTFLNRELLEVSLNKESDRLKLEDVCRKLKTKCAVVKDQVGLVTPRVICMIINEAYFAIQENIASRSDIDLAMKLGTNYPFGPFKWCERIGIKNVYELLKTLNKRTKDERYKICDLLVKEATS